MSKSSALRNFVCHEIEDDHERLSKELSPIACVVVTMEYTCIVVLFVRQLASHRLGASTFSRSVFQRSFYISRCTRPAKIEVGGLTLLLRVHVWWYIEFDCTEKMASKQVSKKRKLPNSIKKSHKRIELITTFWLRRHGIHPNKWDPGLFKIILCFHISPSLEVNSPSSIPHSLHAK